MAVNYAEKVLEDYKKTLEELLDVTESAKKMLLREDALRAIKAAYRKRRDLL